MTGLVQRRLWIPNPILPPGQKKVQKYLILSRQTFCLKPPAKRAVLLESVSEREGGSPQDEDRVGVLHTCHQRWNDGLFSLDYFNSTYNNHERNCFVMRAVFVFRLN